MTSHGHVSGEGYSQGKCTKILWGGASTFFDIYIAAVYCFCIFTFLGIFQYLWHSHDLWYRLIFDSKCSWSAGCDLATLPSKVYSKFCIALHYPSCSELLKKLYRVLLDYLFLFFPYNFIPSFLVKGYIIHLRVVRLVKFLMILRRDTESSRLEPLSLLGKFVWYLLSVSYLELFWAYRYMYLQRTWAELKGPYHGWEP